MPCHAWFTVALGLTRRVCVCLQEFTPTPALLVRQQSGVDTFRSFEKFERRADALSGSANRRFDHRDVDLITAMQGSRLVSHTQAHQNSVVCDMRGFKHPESGRDAVAFLVTSRLANPIMFELTLKCVWQRHVRSPWVVLTRCRCWPATQQVPQDGPLRELSVPGRERLAHQDPHSWQLVRVCTGRCGQCLAMTARS